MWRCRPISPVASPERWLPLLAQLRQADRASLSDDLIAGAITAVLLIPQGMAYALLAGLPAQLGLYAAIVPPIIYALFGSSRVLAVGPVAVAALMVAEALSGFAAGAPDRWIMGAVILAAEVGLLLFLMGALRLGQLVNFISHPVLTGFTTGAALMIIVSQLPILLGVELPRGSVLQTLNGLWLALGQLHGLTLIFSLAALSALLLARRPLEQALGRLGLPPRAALMICRLAPLLILLVSGLLAVQLQAGAAGLQLLGPIPAGLPQPDWRILQAEGWLSLAGPATLIALVAYVESISVAKALAARKRHKIDPNQELRALGLANLGAACVGTLPVAGGFSRSIVNFDAGARSQLSALITAALVALVSLFLTAWFAHLPSTILAAIIVVAVCQLVDFGSLWRHFRYDRADGISQAATLLGVLLLGIEPGLILGIALSLGLYLWRTSQPHIAVIGRVPQTEHFRNVCRHQVETLAHAQFVRVDENLYFANAGRVQQFVAEQLAEHSSLSDLVLVMSAVSYVDASGLELLEQLAEDLRRAGVRLHLAEVKGPVMDRFRASPALLDKLELHLSTEQAFERLQQSAAPRP